MNLLALDTATDTLAAALVCASAARLPTGSAAAPRLHARCAPGGAQASAQLWPTVHALLADAGIALADLAGVAAGCGPGAFTGVRTAVAAAQGLALGLGVPVLALDSLAVVAEDARGQGAGPHVWVAMDARMDEVYAAAYQWDGAQWQVQQAPALWAPETLAAEWQREAPNHVAGNALAAYGTRLGVGEGAVEGAIAGAAEDTADGVGGRIVGSAGGGVRARPGDAAVAPAVRVFGGLALWSQANRAAALARLAAQQAAAGAWLTDPADLQPQYVRNRVAYTTAERMAGRTAEPAAQAAP